MGDSTSIMSLGNKPNVVDSSPSANTKVNSIFPVENFDLIYKRWEDDIIYDSDAVDHLPQPSLPQVDPNDPNFILGIPEEPPVQPTDREKKVCVANLFPTSQPSPPPNLPHPIY